MEWKLRPRVTTSLGGFGPVVLWPSLPRRVVIGSSGSWEQWKGGGAGSEEGGRAAAGSEEQASPWDALRRPTPPRAAEGAAGADVAAGVAAEESCHCLGSACRPVRSHPPGKGGGAWARGGGSPPGLAAQRAASLPPGSPVARGGALLLLAELLRARRGQRGSRGAAVLAGPLRREPLPAERAASGVWKVRRAAVQWSRGESSTCPPSRAKGGKALVSGVWRDRGRLPSPSLPRPGLLEAGTGPQPEGLFPCRPAGGWGAGYRSADLFGSCAALQQKGKLEGSPGLAWSSRCVQEAWN